MNIDDTIKALEEKYFLVKKHSLWSFIGGVFVMLISIGVVSFSSFFAAIEATTTGKTVNGDDGGFGKYRTLRTFAV